MNLFVKDLPPDTQILIAMGAAVAAGCQPCLKQLVSLARSEAMEHAQMQAAVTIGQFVKEQPDREMKAIANALLEVDLVDKTSKIACPCGTEKTAEAGCRG